MSAERDERLLELLLEGDEVRLARARQDPAEAAELQRLEDFLRLAREAAREGQELSSVREGRLVGRVLARTTREDLSWRGELRLVGGFVRERLAASPALRVVAASLLIHLLALPVLAVLIAREPEPEFRLSFDPRHGDAEEAFGEQEEGEVAPEVGVPELDGASPARIENRVRRDRFLLSTCRPPTLDARGKALEIELLAARSEGLTGRRWEDWLLEGNGRSREASLLARTLWAEVLLDRYALAGRRTPLLGELLGALSRDVRVDGREGGPDARLALGTLERARAYGLWEAGPAFDPLAAPDPLSVEGFDLLTAATAGGPLARDAELARWLSWRGR